MGNNDTSKVINIRIVCSKIIDGTKLISKKCQPHIVGVDENALGLKI